MCVTPYAGANRIRFNGTLSASTLSGAGTPVSDGIYVEGRVGGISATAVAGDGAAM